MFKPSPVADISREVEREMQLDIFWMFCIYKHFKETHFYANSEPSS